MIIFVSEAELVAAKIRQMEEEVKAGKRKLIPLSEVLEEFEH